MESIAVVFAAYLVGAIPSAYLIVRVLKGIDLRRYGSGNVGISNAAIHLGKKGVVPLVLFDVLIKGVLPVLIASHRVLHLGLGVEVAVGTAIILGHNWSIYLRFRGGRGMASILGVLVTLNWPLVILYGSVAGIGWLITKNSALWWGIAAVLLPVWSVALRLPLPLTWFCVAFLAITATKRLMSNRPLGASSPRNGAPLLRVMAYRLLYDRDVSNREDWIYRTPNQT